jgi:two-component system, sensor histidine kinase
MPPIPAPAADALPHAAPALAAAAGLALLGLALLAWALQRRRPAHGGLGALLLVAAVCMVWQPVSAALAWSLLALVALAVWLLAGRHARLREHAEGLQAAAQQQQAAAREAAAQAEARLHAQQRQAEEVDQAKTRFLAAASHELRQPVQALALQLDALRSAALDAEQQAAVQRLSAAVAALQAMAGTLLDVSRVNAGAVLPRWDVLPLAPLLRRLADDTAPLAEARGLRLVLRLHDDGAATVSDALLLERVLRNLLDNAVKYTQQGGVLLALRRRTAEGGATLRLEVWDTGPGITPADHERVFQDYQQLPMHASNSASARPAAPGLGLGLALVRDLVQQLQLRLVLHSRPGHGSAFFVEGLPLAAPEPQRVAAARHARMTLQGQR